MRGTNPAWVILIPEDEQVPLALLSGKLLRKQSPGESLVAFVSECVNTKYMLECPKLQQIFHFVIISKRDLQWKNLKQIDSLLLESLTLNSFSTLIVVRAGTLVFWSFDNAIRTKFASLKSKGDEGDWAIVAVVPNLTRYLEALNLLENGVTFDSRFILKNIGDGDFSEPDFSLIANNSAGCMVFTWQNLKYYDGLKIPLLLLNLESMGALKIQSRMGTSDEGSQLQGFWQKELYPELVALFECNEPIDELINKSSGVFGDSQKDWIAIVGMSCRFPKADSIEEYWEILTSGVNTASSPPLDRLGKCELRKDTRGNFLKCSIDEFDASFFEMAPSAVETTDPQTRILLEVSWEAFEDAGMNPYNLSKDSVGIFYGSWLHDYKDIMNMEEKPEKEFLKKYTGNGLGCTAARLSYFYGFMGPNIATESGCSSSIISVNLACQNLQHGSCSVALAAGANLILQMELNSNVVWSKDGICKSFDSKPNGYGRSEGVGVLILKRYSDAIFDSDKIHGIIRGSAFAQEGSSHSFGSPTLEIERKTMVNALKSAKVQPKDVDYVEAHATGTSVGDPIEAAAIVEAYSQGQERERPLLIGSVKTNIGHTEGCSGIASIIKVLLAMKHETIPPHLNVETINPKVDFSPIPGKLVLTREPWKKSTTRPRIAGISNFGISGTESHMIIQEPPSTPNQYKFGSSSLNAQVNLPLHILALSAKSREGLEELTNSFISFLENENQRDFDGTFLRQVTFTANACRAHFQHFRKAIVASDREDMILKLKGYNSTTKEAPARNLKVCFICHGLLNEMDFYNYSNLYKLFPVFQSSMDICNAICYDISGFSLKKILFSHKVASASVTLDHKQLQLCNLSVTYSLYKLWESWGITGNAVLGLNFGELIGAVIAGKLELEQSFRLIHTGEYSCGVKIKRGNGINYISNVKGSLDFGSKEWIEMCLKKENDFGKGEQPCCNLISDCECDIFIHLEIGGSFGWGEDFGGHVSMGKLHLPSYNSSASITPTSELTLTYRLLSALANLYTSGLPVNWEGFYFQRISRRVLLPHYPFQRKSIWFKREKGGPKMDHTRQLSFIELHPLLGNYKASELEVDSGSGKSKSIKHVFENSLVAQHQAPYLSSHVIGSKVIFPGAAHLELLLAANSFQGGAKFPLILENFEIHRPLHFSMFNEMKLRTSISLMEESSTPKWRMWVEAQTETLWNQCASGEFIISQQEGYKYDLDQIKGRCSIKEDNPTEWYNRLAKVGLNFGQEFKTIKSLYKEISSGESLGEIKIPEDGVHYVCHPLLSDAMLQFHILQRQPDLLTLQVPKAIKKFECYRRLTPQECAAKLPCYVYCNGHDDTISLLDWNGSVIAKLAGLELRSTTVNDLLKAAGCGEEAPDIWQVIWKPATKFQSMGSLKNSNDKDFTQSPSFLSLTRSTAKRNGFSSGEFELFKKVERLCQLFVYKAFFELGWEPKVNETFIVTQLAKEFHISPNFYNAFRHYLTYFEGDGVLQILGEGEATTAKVKEMPENREQIEKGISHFVNLLGDYEPLKSLISCASVLAPIMQGKIKGQEILFSLNVDGVYPSDDLYRGISINKNLGTLGSQIFFEVVSQLWRNSEGLQSRLLKVLEVGAGTGIFTKEAVFLLEQQGIEFIYYFTDISSYFLKKAEAHFPNLVFKLFDLEKEPLGQGFPPSYFDIVIGLDVLHATKNLRESIAHLQMVMKEGAHLLLGETNKPIKEVDVTFGIVDGYWGFEDYDIRPTHCTMSAEKWLALLANCGFGGPSSKVFHADSHHCFVVATLSSPYNYKDLVVKNVEDYCDKTWLLLHNTSDEELGWVGNIVDRMRDLNRTCLPLSIYRDYEADPLSIAKYQRGNENLEGIMILCLFEGPDEGLASNNCQSLLEPLLHIFKGFTNNTENVPRVCIATSGLWKECKAHINPAPASIWGLVRCVRMELPWITTKLIDFDPDLEPTLGVQSLVNEIWMGDDETEVIYRKDVRHTRRLTKVKKTKEDLTIPLNTDDYTVQLPKSKLFTDLLYVPKTTNKLAPNQVRVDVRAASLNFKDMLGIMHPKDILENSQIGMDFSGVVIRVGGNVTEIKVGTPVFGICFNENTISRYVNVPVNQLARIPSSITFAEAAALPAAALTALHCLINVAKASPGQTVLIHAASGGVGIFSIQIAKFLGLNIIGTVGNSRKRKFLIHQLGIQHVFSSRTLEYGKKIKGITNGQGVDIVINCLTGPGFKETSLELCKDGAHFVEISKLDIWTRDEVAKMRPGINYTIVNLASKDSTVIARLLVQMTDLLGKGALSPPPLIRFTASRLDSALQLLQKAKHIGKIVLEMPTFDPEKGVWKDNLFNDRSSYLITGGKGAIGLAIAEWMVSRGAKYLVLLGRSSPNEKAKSVIHKLEEEEGAKILCVEADVADFQEMKKVFADIGSTFNLPALRGIHHCAGVLSDRMIGSESWNNFEIVLNPKVKGAYNLHKLTLESPLEFFVVHSSLMCIMGNPGQSNYAAGSLYMEALIESRVAMGLQGMSISWGHWKAGLAENMELETLSAFSIQQGVGVLERFFMENRNSGGVGILKAHKICALFQPYKKTLFEDIGDDFQKTKECQLGEDIEELEMNLPVLYLETEKEGRPGLVMKYVKRKLSDTLGLAVEEVADEVRFSLMGLDSLLSVEFYNKLQSGMGRIELGYIDMEQFGTVEQVSAIIENILDNSAVLEC